MYKVTKPNPNIIARTTDEPIEVGAITLEHRSLDKARAKWDKLQTFVHNDSVSSVKKMGRIHAFIDWLIEDLSIPQLAVCQSGCAHCCKIDVEIGVIEAAYIADKQGLTLLDKKKREHSGYHLKDHYCQFLDQSNGKCTIYEIRPIVCRSFYAFDNSKFCESFDKHAIYASHGNPVIKHIETELFFMGGRRSADIREWFGEYAV